MELGVKPLVQLPGVVDQVVTPGLPENSSYTGSIAITVTFVAGPVLGPCSVETNLRVESEPGALEEVDLRLRVPDIHHQARAAVTGHPQRSHPRHHNQGHYQHQEHYDRDYLVKSTLLFQLN